MALGSMRKKKARVRWKREMEVMMVLEEMRAMMVVVVVQLFLERTLDHRSDRQLRWEKKARTHDRGVLGDSLSYSGSLDSGEADG